MELVGSGRTEKLRLEAGKSNNFVRKTKKTTLLSNTTQKFESINEFGYLGSSLNAF